MVTSKADDCTKATKSVGNKSCDFIYQNGCSPIFHVWLQIPINRDLADLIHFSVFQESSKAELWLVSPLQIFDSYFSSQSLNWPYGKNATVQSSLAVRSSPFTPIPAMILIASQSDICR